MPEFQSTTRLLATSALFMLIIVACNIPFMDGVPDTTLQECSCSIATWPAGGPYGLNVFIALDELMWRTPGEPYSQMDWVGTYEGTTVYADAGCEPHLNGQDCKDCLAAAKASLNNWCHHNVMGDVQLTDCVMRYSDQPL